MKKISKRALTLLVTITFAASTLLYYTPVAFAASVSSHVRVVGTNRTIWFGDVTTDGCTITDSIGVQHTFTQPVAICVLDAVSKIGTFTYIAKDFGGSSGLFLQSIAEDAGASDGSTYWLYDINGNGASVGVSNYVVTSGDSLYFHFENPNTDVNKRAINDGISYLRSQQDTAGQISGFSGLSDWAAMTFAADGIDPTTVLKGGSSLLDYLVANPPTTSSSATDWERAILAIISVGANPFNFGGIDYLSNLETYHNNSQLGSITQVNDDIFGLLALVSAGSGASTTTKYDALNFILSHQNVDGGFSWSTTGTSDMDDTSAALQALVAAQNAGMIAPNLTTAITNAKNFVLASKNSDGGFPYNKGETSNTATTAWTVMAMNAIGAPGQDVTNAKAYIRENQEENGSFKWQSSSVGDTFTSSYTVLALTGKFWPVKIFVGITPTPTVSVSPSPTPSPTSTPTPSPTVTPTSPPIPSVTLSPNPKPTPTITPSAKLSERYERLLKREREKLIRIQEQQRRILERLYVQIQRQLNNLSRLINALGMHK